MRLGYGLGVRIDNFSGNGKKTDPIKSCNLQKNDCHSVKIYCVAIDFKVKFLSALLSRAVNTNTACDLYNLNSFCLKRYESKNAKIW